VEKWAKNVSGFKFQVSGKKKDGRQLQNVKGQAVELAPF
jgi:hypothetical protein